MDIKPVNIGNNSVRCSIAALQPHFLAVCNANNRPVCLCADCG